jgi:cytochrome c oxidase subunit 2
MRMKRLLISLAAGLTLGLLPVASVYAKAFYDFTNPVTPVAKDTLYIHDLFLAIITVIFIVSFAFLLYTLVSHRRSRNPTPATFTAPKTRFQWFLSALPILIMIFIDYVVLGIPSVHAIMDLANNGNDQMTVVATASQWKWNYAYPAYGVKFNSVLSTPNDEIYGNAPKDKHFLLEVDHPLVVPINEKVGVVLKSRDVIHGFWVPAFGIKQDVIPGFLRKTWFKIDKPGTYRGQCSELCGVGHSFMPIVVVAKTPAQFKIWLASEQAKESAATAATSKTWAQADLMVRGKKVFDKNCASCHQASGMGIPGVFPPIATGHAFSASKAMLADLTKRGFYKDGTIVEGSVSNHIGIVLNGIPGTAMPAFKKQLSATDIASVITFERNAFGNHTGQTVQPEKIQQALSGAVK